MLADSTCVALAEHPLRCVSHLTRRSVHWQVTLSRQNIWLLTANTAAWSSHPPLDIHADFMTSHTTLHRTISFTADAKLAPPSDSTMSSAKSGRRRRSSSIIYQEPPETVEQISDQAVNPNLNSQWVNAKGWRQGWQWVKAGVG